MNVFLFIYIVNSNSSKFCKHTPLYLDNKPVDARKGDYKGITIGARKNENKYGIKRK